MHSVVVLGDVRTHIVDIEKNEYWENQETPSVRKPEGVISLWFHGGAVLMKSAVEKSLEGKKTQIYGYQYRKEMLDVGETYRWFLKPFTVEEEKKPRPRLELRSTAGRPKGGKRHPRFDEKLLKILSTANGKFEETSTDNQNQTLPNTDRCPDVVVFDDLGFGLRNFKFEIPNDPKEIETKEDVIKQYLEGTAKKALAIAEEALATAKETLATAEEALATAEEALATAEETLATAKEALATEEETLATAVYGLLLRRFQDAKNALKKIPRLEPVIIGSIKNYPQNLLKNRLESNSPEKTVWEHLFDDEWLRERTTLLLDAADLRKSGYTISGGLSWERTAQDTVSEFWKREELRPLLEFKQVIVRYGVTGALHIIRRSDATWTYHIVFDPAHDDVAWADEQRDGEVLGVSSIYTATMVESLGSHCGEQDGMPFMGPYSTVIASSLPSAISRARYLNQVGYGVEGWENFNDNFDQNNQPSFPNWMPKYIFENPYEECKPGFDLKPNVISSSSVSAMVANNWSIVGQSAQGRYGMVARDIVMYGSESILNQPVLTRDIITTCITETVMDVVKKEFNLTDTDDFRKQNTKSRWDSIILKLASSSLQENKEVFGSRSPRLILDITKIDLFPVQKIVEGVSRKTPISEASIRSILTTELKEHEKEYWLPAPADVPPDPLAAPLVAFPSVKSAGRSSWSLFIIDRQEIEGYRAVRKLMRQHIENVQKGKNSRPLCIAVFGPPGSGKSTAVKKINESLPNMNTDIIKPAFNVAQFEGLSDLGEAFEEIMKRSKDSTVPIAFFDEFDTSFGDNSEPLGWLKYFLAPMEDGDFKGKSVKNAILVFAGGTSRTFSEFSLANRSRTDQQWINFSKSKGPDFTSRLLGHLDIVGSNPVGTGDELYMIRRAILMRSLLTIIQSLKQGDKAKITSDMLNAFLHVPKYRHGGRSVRMLLELCRSSDGYISSSALPPLHQLDMLVDGQAFVNLLSDWDSRRSK